MTIIGDMSVLNTRGHTKYCYYVACVDCYVIGTIAMVQMVYMEKLSAYVCYLSNQSLHHNVEYNLVDVKD